MATLSYSGIDLHYECTGAGQPVLLLAGIASDSMSWKPVIKELAIDAQVITMDNRCAGQTRPLSIETSRDLMVQDVLALLDACHIDKVTLIGHSMGALISWAVAAKAPDRISALVSASAPITIDPTRIELFNTLAQLRTNENETVWFRMLFQFLFSTNFFEDPNTIDEAVTAALSYEHKQSLGAFAQQCKALPSYLEPLDLPATLPFPSLALTGANDRLFTPNDMQSIFASHPNVRLSIIDKAAHSVHWENPIAFVDVVRSFLADLT